MEQIVYLVIYTHKQREIVIAVFKDKAAALAYVDDIPDAEAAAYQILERVLR